MVKAYHAASRCHQEPLALLTELGMTTDNPPISAIHCRTAEVAVYRPEVERILVLTFALRAYVEIAIATFIPKKWANTTCLAYLAKDTSNGVFWGSDDSSGVHSATT